MGALKLAALIGLVLLVVLLLQQETPPAAENGPTTCVSRASDGRPGNGDSHGPSISADGRYVAFYSDANNLVSDDRNSKKDVFVHDRQTGQTTRVSVASGGRQGNGDSYPLSISAAGRYVAFSSEASNLVEGDTNDCWDVFVHDRQTGQTTRVSVAADGSQGNDDADRPSISADGRYVAFYSYASNLVGDDSNGFADVFVHDRQTGRTTRVSMASDGAQGDRTSIRPSISAAGRYVAFQSQAGNLMDGDEDGDWDIFVHDRQTGQTTCVSAIDDGIGGNQGSYAPSISADGRYVAFYSDASNLVADDSNGWGDVFVHDRQTGQTTRVSVAGAGNTFRPSISADGRYVALCYDNISPSHGDSNSFDDVFVHDRQTNRTSLISAATGGGQVNGDAHKPSISADGRYVAFQSQANNLLGGGSNGFQHVYVRDQGD